MALTQKQMILVYMKAHDGITQAEATRDIGCMRLGARISDLRTDGIKIRSDRETSLNRFGKKVSYVRYRLVQSSC